MIEEKGFNLAGALASLARHREHIGLTLRRTVDQLEVDIASPTFIVTVLGEFKRGKSTMLNALLGRDLLPHDVTPTTAAICVLRHSVVPLLIVHRADGAEEHRELLDGALEAYTADADFDPASVDYLEIGIPSDILAGGLVIVDTPGVNDLNHHRSEVAARFVPRSDAVVFVLSAAAPVRRTELEFLDTSVLESGLDRILFVANFADLIEEDELTDLRQRVARRLAPALRGHEPTVVALSASVALDAAVSGDGDLLEQSGLEELRRAVADLADINDRSSVRSRRFLHRTRLGMLGAIAEVEQVLALSQKELDELVEELAIVDSALAKKSERSERLGQWVDDRRSEILQMVRKSLVHLRTRLVEQILDMVDAHKSSDFKEFVEERVPRLLKTACRDWVETHTSSVMALVGQLDQRVSVALGEEFATYVARLRPEGAIQLGAVDISSTQVDDISQAPFHATVAVGGVAALAVAMHAMVFVPVVGIVALPFVTKYYMDRKLTAAKEKAKPELTDAIGHSLSGFSSGVLQAVDDEILAVRVAGEARFDELMSDLRSRIADEIATRQQAQEGQKRNIEAKALALADFRRDLLLIEDALVCPAE